MIVALIAGVIIILLAFYLVLLQQQLHNINRQLDKRLKEQNRQPIRLELINRELSSLVGNINRCLKAEENLRLNSVREEKQFKEMIANISHDLRTPLTAIKGYQQLIESSELSKEQHDKLRIARKHANELEGLINQFFEYSYLLNADLSVQTERVNVTNFVAECLADSIAVFEQNNRIVLFEGSEPVFAMVNTDSIMRILQNLIRNCIAHSEGDIKVRVFATDSAVIVFENQVKNMPSEDAEHLFDRFYAIDKARSKSTGLGLSIVKLLAEQMGGSASARLNNEILTIQVKLKKA